MDVEDNMVDVNMASIGDVVAEWEVKFQALEDFFILRLVISMRNEAIFPVTVLRQALFLEERVPIL